MAQLQNVTVNGRPAVEYLAKEKSREIEEFLRGEFRSMGRMTRHHIRSANGNRNTSRPVDAGNGSIRFE